jgi:HK97 family phage prohead protease
MFAPSTIDDENRTVEVVFGSDTPVRMWTWEYGVINEKLSFEENHVRMERLNSGAPLLDNHDSYGSVSDIVLGVVERAWMDKGKGYAKIRFANNEKGKETLELVKDGIVRNISVGYQVNKYQVTRAMEKGELDLYRAVDWEPYEVSIVAVPADYSAQIRMAGEGHKVEIEYDKETLAIVEAERAERETQELLNQRRRELDHLLARF